MQYFPSAKAVRQRGFTLIEMLVVMAIIAILAAVAYPSYVGHIARGKRAEARATLFAAAQFMERYYSAKSEYADAVLPARLTTAPIGAAADAANYEITLAATATDFTLTAKPLFDDVCGSLKLTQTGVRTRTATALSNEACWK